MREGRVAVTLDAAEATEERIMAHATRDRRMTEGFTTVYGRSLVGELPAFVHRPYLVVTMEDLWPLFEAQLDGPGLAGVHCVTTLEVDELEAALSAAAGRAPASSGSAAGRPSMSPSSSPGDVACRCSRCPPR